MRPIKAPCCRMMPIKAKARPGSSCRPPADPGVRRALNQVFEKPAPEGSSAVPYAGADYMSEYEQTRKRQEAPPPVKRAPAALRSASSASAGSASAALRSASTGSASAARKRNGWEHWRASGSTSAPAGLNGPEDADHSWESWGTWGAPREEGKSLQLLQPDATDFPCRKKYAKTFPPEPIISTAGKAPGYKLWLGDIPGHITVEEIRSSWCRAEWALQEVVVKDSCGHSDDQYACFTFREKRVQR